MTGELRMVHTHSPYGFIFALRKPKRSLIISAAMLSVLKKGGAIWNAPVSSDGEVPARGTVFIPLSKKF